MITLSNFSKKRIVSKLSMMVCAIAGLTAMGAWSQTDIALNKPVTASSNQNMTNTADKAVDGNSTTRWESQWSDPQWIRIDLGATYSVNRVTLVWERASAKDYRVDMSADGTNWTTLVTKTNMANSARTDDLTGLTGSGRYIRMYGTARTTTYGYSIYTFSVYGSSGNTYTLSTSVNPSGSGSISLSPSGGTYAAGTVVTVTATPASGYQFSNWSGVLSGTANPATVTMNANYSLTANFTANTFQTGDMSYYNGTAWTRIPRGNSGQVLTENGSLIPTWTDNGKWINYTSSCTIEGWSVYDQKSVRYAVVGKIVFINVWIYGTSNSTTASISLPIQLSGSTWYIETPYYYWSNTTPGLGNCQISCSDPDNGCGKLKFYTNEFNGVFSSTGHKSVHASFFYEIN